MKEMLMKEIKQEEQFGFNSLDDLYSEYFH